MRVGGGGWSYEQLISAETRFQCASSSCTPVLSQHKAEQQQRSCHLTNFVCIDGKSSQGCIQTTSLNKLPIANCILNAAPMRSHRELDRVKQKKRERIGALFRMQVAIGIGSLFKLVVCMQPNAVSIHVSHVALP